MRWSIFLINNKTHLHCNIQYIMLVAISGGIGSGKSIVARMLAVQGYRVYDCDIRARDLINKSESIKEIISDNLGSSCIADDGSLNRKVVSDIVFNNAEKLKVLNSITHSAVREDLSTWNIETSGELKFVETAILYQSGIDKMVDAVIEVIAPLELRIDRIVRRNGLDRNSILQRIQSQKLNTDQHHAVVFNINNDDETPILPQLNEILGILNGQSSDKKESY